ncbi:MAG: HEAT repeat domain-containing protein, partial [Candidatus Eisenbacteria bacterium]
RSARGPIERRLCSPHVELRIAACRALGRLGLAEAGPGLTLALADDAWPVRALAAQALGRIREAHAVEALVERVSDRSWWVRHHAAYALATVGPEGRDALCELIVRSDDPYAREMARDALDQHSSAQRSA